MNDNPLTKSRHTPVSGRKSKSCSHLLCGSSMYWVKLHSRPQTSSELVVFIDNSTTIKAILISDYFLIIYIKNAITKYIQIWAYCLNLCQNVEIWTPFLFFSFTHARRLLMAYSIRFIPPIFNWFKESLLCLPDCINHL